MKILLADDHILFRDGMRYVLQQVQGGEPDIIEVGNYDDAVKVTEKHSDLDLALLDIKMPGSDGLLSIRAYRRHFPQVPLVVVSGDEGWRQMERVMQDGAMGFICKTASPSVMLNALNLVLAGGVYVPPQLVNRIGKKNPRPCDEAVQDKRSEHTNQYGLTKRQMEVILYLYEGLSNKAIAEKMEISVGTVKVHVAAIFQTLKVNNRMAAVQEASRLGLIVDE